MSKPTWRGGECRILMLNESTRELRAWQYLKIKEVFGCSDAELRFVRVKAVTAEEVFNVCREWGPEAVLIKFNPDDPRAHLATAAGYAVIAFTASDHLVRIGSNNEPFTPREVAPIDTAKGNHRYGDPGPMGLDAIDHGRNDL